MYIKEKLRQLGFDKTTPIQDGVFSVFNNKRHIVGLAPTGTGKTHAYLLPILEKIDLNLKQVQAIIIVPTNELVIQVHQMLVKTDDRFIVKAYDASHDKSRDVLWLKKQQPQIVITTPSRLKYVVVDQQALVIKYTKYLVLDEADMMFDEEFMGWIDEFIPILKDAKYLLFSATITKQMEPFIKAYFGQYELIDTSKDHKLDIEYQLINIKYQDRLESLKKVISHINPFVCFIFVSKKENQDIVYGALSEMGLNVINFKSSLGIKRRKQIIDEIKETKYQYVVTSDLAARGLDFNVSHVIHFDLPHHLEFFMHRSGRTGRMNASGHVIAFLSVDDHRKVEKIKKLVPFKEYQLTPDGMVEKVVKKRVLSDAEVQAIKSIKKPKKVKPNYKKKNKANVTKAKKQARRKELYDKNR
ncbi:MAG: DEAD/DEAH box helicase [Acholeplasmataceae bacterium]